MSARALARQYANALFDVVQKNGQVEQARQALSAFGAAVTSHEELSRVLASPAVSLSQKKAITDALVGAIGGVPEAVGRLLGLLADRDRLTFAGVVADAFAEKVMDAGQIVHAEITSAVALDDHTRSGLSRALGQALDRQVTMTERVDPALVGGLVARVGSVVFDGSVIRQVERLREKLLADV